MGKKWVDATWQRILICGYNDARQWWMRYSSEMDHDVFTVHHLLMEDIFSKHIEKSVMHWFAASWGG